MKGSVRQLTVTFQHPTFSFVLSLFPFFSSSFDYTAYASLVLRALPSSTLRHNYITRLCSISLWICRLPSSRASQIIFFFSRVIIKRRNCRCRRGLPVGIGNPKPILNPERRLCFLDLKTRAERLPDVDGGWKEERRDEEERVGGSPVISRFLTKTKGSWGVRRGQQLRF